MKKGSKTVDESQNNGFENSTPIKIPRKYTTEDEGFCSIKSSPASLKKSYLSKNQELWDSILNYELSDYIDWDMRNEYI